MEHDRDEVAVGPEEFERRLKSLFEAVEEAREQSTRKGPVRWFAEHRLVDLTRKQIYNYINGTTPIPDRIVAVLELLEDEHGVADE